VNQILYGIVEFYGLKIFTATSTFFANFQAYRHLWHAMQMWRQLLGNSNEEKR